jgi:LytR cell envelope-related transcriptional attenuator/Protein of unknown function (DUF2510)
MSNEGDSPPAQWAADPTGQHDYRFWDGSQWTEYTSDRVIPLGAPGALPAPPATTRAAAREAARGGRHRRRGSRKLAFWLGAVLGAAVVAGAGAAAVYGFHVKVNAPASKHSTRSVSTPTPVAATTTTAFPGRPPGQVRVDVLNGSGMPGAASTKAFALGAIGYKVASVGNASGRHGNAVQCRPGFEAEATTLAKNVGTGTTVEPFPSPAPAGSANADCVVVLGQ